MQHMLHITENRIKIQFNFVLEMKMFKPADFLPKKSSGIKEYYEFTSILLGISKDFILKNIQDPSRFFREQNRCRPNISKYLRE